ncbi:MAG: carboxypeptidase-like regulatory domain-containing protein [Nostoc sp.]
MNLISSNGFLLAATIPINKTPLIPGNPQKQIFIKAPIENILQPESFVDEQLPILLTQKNSTPLKNDNLTTFIIGLNIGTRNVSSGVLVRGKATDKEAINFENWLIPYDAFLQALRFTSKSISENEVELRSPFKIIRLNINQLRNDPELGLVLSIKEIKDIFGIESKFDWREYVIVFDIPEEKPTNSNNSEKKPVILTGLPKISAPDITLSMMEQRGNFTGTNISDFKNQGTLSAVGTIFDSSWFVRINQSDMTDRKTWQLSELQILKQTDYSDYYLGSQPTFWRSQSGGDFWGFTTIQRQGFSPFPTYGSGGANPSQRLQPERVSGTVTGRAEPGTLARLVRNIYSREVIAEQLVNGSATYRFDNIPVGRQIGTNYQVLLYPGGVLTAQPQIQDARFNLLPEQLSVGTSALIVSGGWKRHLNNNDFLGEFTQFNAGISQRWGLTKDLTVGLGGVYDSSFQGLAELFYQPQKSPLRVTVSGGIGDDIKINTNVTWNDYPNLYATLSNDLKSTLYTLDYKISNQFRFYSSGSLDQNKNFGLGYSSSSANSSTYALVNVDTSTGLSWSLDQRLGKLYLNHRGNHTSTSSQLSYLFNPYQSLIFNYETLSSSQNSNLLTAYWRYTSPTITRYGDYLWQGELGYRIGSSGTGIYGTLGTAILPGILLQARYEGISLNSDQSSFSLQLVSSLGFQQGIIPGDRQIQRLRTEGGLLVQAFFDRNSNGKRDNHEEMYNDNSEFLILNNEVVKPSQIDIQSDRMIMRLPPGTYRVDLDPAGFPPDFQPAINTFAVKVVEGSYTPVLIPLQPSYTLAGIATDAQGKPIAGAKVEAIDTNSKSSVISITNSAGVFYLEQLRQGTYQLKINGKLSEPNTITIKADSNTLQELNLKLP